MAGDWLKIEKATAGKPEIAKLAKIFGWHTDQALGACVRFWSWCDDQLKTGNVDLSPDNVDDIMHIAGFGNALSTVGWLRVRNGSLEVPNFERHLSRSAKVRADATLRKRLSRDVTKTCDKNGTTLLSSQSHEDSLKEEEIPEELRTEEFLRAWGSWKKHRAEIKKKLTPTQREKQLAKCVKLGVDRAVAMIEHTIEKGWVGWREPDEGDSPGNPDPRGNLKLREELMAESDDE